MPIRLPRLVALCLFFFLTFTAAWVGSRFMPDAWYVTLNKPGWTPPNWLFAPVWSTLYIMIALAGWQVWCKVDRLTHPALLTWLGQLLLNGLWTWLFFGLHELIWALADILLLLMIIAGFIRVGGAVQRMAAWLFVPYFVWVSYATALTAAIVWLNLA